MSTPIFKNVIYATVIGFALGVVKCVVDIIMTMKKGLLHNYEYINQDKHLYIHLSRLLVYYKKSRFVVPPHLLHVIKNFDDIICNINKSLPTIELVHEQRDLLHTLFYQTNTVVAKDEAFCSTFQNLMNCLQRYYSLCKQQVHPSTAHE